jgi:hypothetical protein
VEGKRSLSRKAAGSPTELLGDTIQLVAMSRAAKTSAARILKIPIKENPITETTAATVSAIESLEIGRLSRRAGG